MDEDSAGIGIRFSYPLIRAAFSFFRNFDENDIVADLADAVPWDHKILAVAEKPQNFTGPGRTSPVRCPVFGLNSTSIGQPSVLQVQILITSFWRRSTTRMRCSFLQIPMENICENVAAVDLNFTENAYTVKVENFPKYLFRNEDERYEMSIL